MKTTLPRLWQAIRPKPISDNELATEMATCDTEYFGGIEIIMCTWSGIRCPSSIRHSFCVASRRKLRIPAMPITHSDLMAITIPSDADHRRSGATLGISYHAEVIGIRQCFCDRSGATLATSAEKGVRGKGAQPLFLASAL